MPIRQCPTIAGDFRPLILQSISTCICLTRQEEQYHKCHRCLYRGKPADFRLPERSGPIIVMLPRPEDRGVPTAASLRVLQLSEEERARQQGAARHGEDGESAMTRT